jgi:hypothetical protein
MEGKGPKSAHLRLIRGALVRAVSLGDVRVVAAPKDSPPFQVEAVAFEEDTFLVMSADTAVRDPKVPLVRIMTRLMETQPEVPGTVLVRGGSPTRLLAVIHDLNQDPSWKEEWIAAALTAVFEESQRRGFRSLALPLLGTVHGRLERKRAVELLVKVLRQRTFQHLRWLWLMVPSGAAREVIELLKSGYGEPARSTP